MRSVETFIYGLTSYECHRAGSCQACCQRALLDALISIQLFAFMVQRYIYC